MTTIANPFRAQRGSVATLAVLGLLVANVVAFGVLTSARTATALGLDACDETVETSCDCWGATVWYNAGCYSSWEDTLYCSSGAGCKDDCKGAGKRCRKSSCDSGDCP